MTFALRHETCSAHRTAWTLLPFKFAERNTSASWARGGRSNRRGTLCRTPLQGLPQLVVDGRLAASASAFRLLRLPAPLPPLEPPTRSRPHRLLLLLPRAARPSIMEVRPKAGNRPPPALTTRHPACLLPAAKLPPRPLPQFATARSQARHAARGHCSALRAE